MALSCLLHVCTRPDIYCAAQNLHAMQQVLNLIMFRLRKQPYDEAQLAFLAVDEHLVDIGDDLCECLQLHTMLTMPMSCAPAVVRRETCCCLCR